MLFGKMSGLQSKVSAEDISVKSFSELKFSNTDINTKTKYQHNLSKAFYIFIRFLYLYYNFINLLEFFKYILHFLFFFHF